MESHLEGRTLLRHGSWDSPAMKARSVLDRTTSDIAEPDMGSMESEETFKNRSLQATAAVEEAAPRHIGFGGMPGDFRARPVAHGKVHIATLIVKADAHGDGVPKDVPTSTACVPPAALRPVAAGAFLDMACAMPDLPRINCAGNDKSWLDEALQPLQQSVKQQHGPGLGNLCHDGVSANYAEALDPSPPGTPNEYSSFLQSDTDIPHLSTIDILGQTFDHESSHEAHDLSRLGLLGMLPGGDLFSARDLPDQAQPSLYKLAHDMLGPAGWRDGGATTSAAHPQPLFPAGCHSQSEQSAVHFDSQHHHPQWQGLQTYKSTSASSPVLVEQGRGFSGDGSHSFGPQEAYTSPLNQARPGVPTPSSHYFDPSIYDLHTDQLPSFECLASRFVNHAHAPHAHTAALLGHARVPLPVPYHDCPVDPSTISADMMEDHPSSYIHYEVPASNLERQGNTPQSQRRPTKQHRSLLMLPDYAQCYGSGGEDQVSGALESRPPKAKPLKGGVSKGPGGLPRRSRRMCCINCHTSATPQWRCGPDGPRTLCNACGVRYKKGNGTGGRKSVRATCKICGTKKTPQWRCGPDGPRTLCNACGLKYRKGQLPGDDDSGLDITLVDDQLELPEGQGGTLVLPPV